MSRTHLVTGAGSGIGLALARLLRERQDTLVLPVRSRARVEQLRDEFAEPGLVVLDLADTAALPDALRQAHLPSRLDTVVHAAGVVELSSVADQPDEGLREQLEVNLVAPMLLTRACLPALRRTRGTVVFVNSGAGLVANPEWSAYAASKFGLRAFADSLRAEEAAAGVRVTSVFPSRTATPMQALVHEQEGRAYDPSHFMSAESVAATILHVLDLPEDVTIPEVSLRSR
ncbi:SDR family oxidoreductase [Nocardioides daejeonensis]|uniref:SDR family oxidoreductase n=1 Tax=Nocardioides daejeonensis TaxID=1046556 RepID=UPI000D74FEF3|nr:SDR family oxidoreductase [Nocardioides daejeonensis]